MKSLGGIGAIILGVVAILVSIGLQTIWAPPAVFNATTHTTEEAPLTIVTNGVDIDPDDASQYTVSGDGDFTLMYGQLRDIEAWVGDAAHHRIDGITTDVDRGQDPTVDITYIDGEATVPNPANSDLWLATQDVTDTVTQRWTRNDAGEWALLIAVDGTEPAPTDFSVSWVNVEPDSPIIMPIMIGGIVLILIGLALLIWRFLDFRRRAKRTSGRRAAIRGEYTGLTAADVRADNGATETIAIQQVDAGEPVEDYDEGQMTEVVAGTETSEANDDQSVDEDFSDDDPGDSDASDPDAGEDIGDDSHADDVADEQTTDQENPEDEPKGFLRRVITGATALGLAAGLGIGPAYADTETPVEEDISEQVDQEELEADRDPEAPETFPVVVDAQLSEILEAVAATVARGDQELDADLITGRVAGHAWQEREAFYRNNDIDSDYADPVPIGVDVVLATWMDRDEAFPRTIYTVTQDDEGSTQLLVLRQQDARSQYQLIHNAPFAPGVELPGGKLSDHDVTNLAADETTDLVMSPLAAMEATAAYLDDADADSADQIADNDWIDAIHKHQDAQEAEQQEHETDVTVTRSIFDDSVQAVRLPNGSALVFGTMNSMESLTPAEGATMTLPELTQELGGFSSPDVQEKVRIRYREQVALLLPAEGEVSLVGYETVQSTVD